MRNEDLYSRDAQNEYNIINNSIKLANNEWMELYKRLNKLVYEFSNYPILLEEVIGDFEASKYDNPNISLYDTDIPVIVNQSTDLLYQIRYLLNDLLTVYYDYIDLLDIVNDNETKEKLRQMIVGLIVENIFVQFETRNILYGQYTKSLKTALQCIANDLQNLEKIKLLVNDNEINDVVCPKIVSKSYSEQFLRPSISNLRETTERSMSRPILTKSKLDRIAPSKLINVDLITETLSAINNQDYLQLSNLIEKLKSINIRDFKLYTDYLKSNYYSTFLQLKDYILDSDLRSDKKQLFTTSK